LSPERAAAPPTAAAEGGPARAYTGLFALSCFFPYPALALGTKTGLQLSQALALAAAPVLAAAPAGRTFRALVVLLTPLYVSAFVNAMRVATPDPAVLPKEAVAATLAVCVLWPAAWLARHGRFRQALGMAAAATAAHALLGLYQAHSFEQGFFPLMGLYRNPSFKPMESWVDIYVRYIKRPCGLFPEPSAMSAAMGPWLVAVAGVLSDRQLARRLGVGVPERRLYAAALAAGMLLLSMSRSGATLIVMAAVVAVVAQGVRSLELPSGFVSLIVALVLSAGAGLGVTYLVMKVGSNLDARIESSWGLRAASIVAGLTGNTAPLDLAFGVGPGQSTAVVNRMLAGFPMPAEQGSMALWSLSVTYYMETGLAGALAMLLVAATAARAVWRSSARIVGAASAGVWVVGVTVTTSYMALSPIWLMLGALLVWDEIFPGAGAGARGVRP
jgi:hypothetical protein